MVCYYSYNDIKVYDRLQELYAKYGYVLDQTVSISYSGLNAMKDMTAVVDGLKTKQVDKVGTTKVNAVRDYSSLTRTLSNGEKEKLESASANAIYYELEGDGFICVRPSGTEPKLKIYYSVKGESYQKAQEIFNQVKQNFEKLVK